MPALPGLDFNCSMVEAHLARPVRVLPGGSREVLLEALFREIFLVDGQELGRRPRQKSNDGIVQFAGQFRIGLGLTGQVPPA